MNLLVPSTTAGKAPAFWRFCSCLMNKCVQPCLLAMLVTPLLTFLHEGGHYVVALGFGAEPHLHFGYVRIAGLRTTVSDFWSNAAGPFVDWLFAISGFFWLRHRRRARGDALPALLDWLALIFVLRASGSIFNFWGALAATHVVPDEAEMSLLLGLPKWLLPGASTLVAVFLIGSALRALPRGYRFLPVVCIFLGSTLGVVAQVVVYHLWTGKLPELPSQHGLTRSAAPDSSWDRMLAAGFRVETASSPAPRSAWQKRGS